MGSSIHKSATKKHPGFTIACGLFACIAFAQLVAIGVSIAARTGETREVIRYVKTDPLIISVPTLRDPLPRNTDFTPRTPAQLIEAYTSESDDLHTHLAPTQPAPTPHIHAPVIGNIPEIANSRVAALILTAQKLHVKGDLIATIFKLEDAESLAPNEPAVFYEKAKVFEDMGNWDRATDNYEKLFKMGPAIGVYYDKAAFKLSNGINPIAAKQDLFIIGNILRRISPDKLSARLTIPIRSTPEGEFDATLLEVKIHHYDLVDNKKVEAVPLSRAGNIKDRWINPRPDWSSNEEFAESVYTLPKADAAEVHIFGERKYFGYVAELYYKNELIDQQAFPRRLHALHAKLNHAPGFADPYDFPFDEALPNINPDNPLLPALPRR